MASSGGWGVKVDLSGFDLKKQAREVNKGLQEGFKTVALQTERIMKPLAPVAPHGGRLRSSISITPKKFQVRIGPHVVYMGWANDGRDSPHAPKTHRGSSFKGHKFIQRTHDKISKTAQATINKAIGRRLKR